VNTFIILWIGQLASTIGSSMTYFAITLWVWQQSESVTAIALLTFFFQLPQIGVAVFSGLIVDHFSRKSLLILSDVIMALCSLAVGILAALQQLQLWQLYGIAALYGCFNHLQTLTQTTIVPLMVDSQHLARASSMGAVVEYSAIIIAPALAGVLYPVIGLLNITLIDLATFAIAVLTLLSLTIPALPAQSSPSVSFTSLGFGFRYIAKHATLKRLIIILSLFAFAQQMTETLTEPLILVRTHGNAHILGVVSAASGLGGVVGGILFSLWGGFQRPVHGMLVGFLGLGMSSLVFGLGQIPFFWVSSQFCVSLHTPLIFSSYMALWYAKVPPALQGRVFAADHLIGLAVSAMASLMAGPLAENIFEPAVQQNSWLHPLTFWNYGSGSGIALLYVFTALYMVLIGIGGFAGTRQNPGKKIRDD
jgi:MFS transporter, DHA3 family, macrolide efflux protein